MGMLSAVQVIDGALAATKAQLEILEAEKEALEAQVSQMRSEHDTEVSSLSHQLATLRSGLAEAAQAAPAESSEIVAVKAELMSLQVLVLAIPENRSLSYATFTGMQLMLPNHVQCNAFHVLEIDHLKRRVIAANHTRWAWPQEAGRLKEDALLAEIEQLKEAAAAREATVGEKVRSTQAALDAVLPELEESNRALAASVEEGAARAEELGTCSTVAVCCMAICAGLAPVHWSTHNNTANISSDCKRHSIPLCCAQAMEPR